MRIDMNPIGNYSPISVRNVNNNTKTNAVTPKETTQKAVQAKQGTLTPEEKTFFANLYPENKSEVVDYHFYEKSGKLSGVKIGSLIDRRG
jgi:hypothetical protein